MMNIADGEIVKAVEKHAVPLAGAMRDYDPIIQAARGKHFVLIGEASHGTKEFYHMRAEITQRLIEEQGFDAVAVEADWPDAYTVNRYVSGRVPGMEAEEALSDFERFPTWMWRNAQVLHFARWLSAYNRAHRPPTHGKDWLPVGFYGLDLYSMSTSIEAVIAYLDKVDPMAARRARVRYGCLDQFMDNPQTYGYAAEAGIAESCELEIVTQLIDLRKKSYEYMQKNGFVARDDYFCAEQNAKLVKNAEEYYRSMFRGRPNSWNVRDQHMFETLNDLRAYLSTELGRKSKIVVWAHNSHIGNAAATDMARRGEFNIGQLARQAYGHDALLVGFSTAHGTVTAASDWDMPSETKQVRKPLPGSYEEIFHHVNYKQFLLDLRGQNTATDLLAEPRLQRAIGVIYRPETERMSHYYHARLPEQFDFVIHIDETHAVGALTPIMRHPKGELDETYPYGL